MKLTDAGLRNIIRRISYLGLSHAEFARQMGYDSIPKWLTSATGADQHIDRNLELLCAVLRCPRAIGSHWNDFEVGYMAMDAEQKRERMDVSTVKWRLEELARSPRPLPKGIFLSIIAGFLLGVAVGHTLALVRAPDKEREARAAALATPVVIMPTAMLPPVAPNVEAVAPKRIK